METQPLIGLASLTRMAFAGIDLTPLGATLIERIQSDPADAGSLMDLSTILLSKNRPVALATQREALRIRQLYHLPVATQPALRLLAIMAPGDLMANTPLEFVLDGSDVALDLLYVSDDLPSPASLPPHDLVFVGVGESDASRALLRRIESLVALSPRRVVNAPDRILQLSRDGAGELLASAPGIVMPRSARVDRGTLHKIESGELAVADVLAECVFPMIIRPVGSHMGIGLARLDSPSEIAAYLVASPAAEFFISRFVDYSREGQFWKYRVVLIDGQPYACHLAISGDWIVHYRNANMAESADKRAAEERWMVTFDDDFARRHQAAFHAVHERTGLDYIGIDCSETADGELLIFEVDSAVIIHAMDPVDVFPYKQPQMKKVFHAFRAMLDAAMRRPSR